MTARPRDPDPLTVSLVLFVIAFAARFAASSWLGGEPVWDGHYYDFGARRIAEGHGYSDDRLVMGQTVWHPWCHYPVGYSAYLAAFYATFGSSRVVASFANALVGGLLAVVVYLLGREGLSPLRARLAGALVALHPGLVLYGALTMSEPLSALVTMGAFWIAIASARRWPTRLAGFLGPAAGALVLGVGALVRPQALLCAPLLALAIPPPRRSLVTWSVGAALASVLALVPILPWTARNCRVMDGCALVSTNAGWNLAIGAFPRATGRFEGLHSSDGCREVTGQVQQDRCWLRYGLEHIRRDPIRWLSLVPAKLSYTFDHESFAVEYLHEARPAAFPEARRSAWREALTLFHRLLVVASPLGFVAFVPSVRSKSHRVQTALLGATLAFAAFAFTRDVPVFWPIVLLACVLAAAPLRGRPENHPALTLSAVLVATTALAHAVFFGEDRYHMAVVPALCLFAAAALRRPGAGAVEAAAMLDGRKTSVENAALHG